MPPGVEETDMERKVNAEFCVMGAEHVKGMAEIEDFFIAVPTPVGIGVREMASAGTMGFSVFPAMAELMPIRGSVGMDTGAVAGEGEAVGGDEAFVGGREDGKEAVGLQFQDPVRKAGKAKQHHKYEGAKDLCLVLGRPPERGKVH